MNRDKRDMDYPVELESQFILRLPEEPAKLLRELLKSGENMKNRLTIQIFDDMRNGEVKFDHWLLHGKMIDLPTIVESLKTNDRKSFYKTADICQMMICKEEPHQLTTEEESPGKNKKKDPFKVDKKFLWPHGLTPPTKNVRRRRFRKTLKKKCAEGPEIEKEVKRLLRADNEAVQVSWEIIKEDVDEQPTKTETKLSGKNTKKMKAENITKKDVPKKLTEPSNVVDIFGGAVSDSEEEDFNAELEDSRLSAYDSRMSDTNSMLGTMTTQKKNYNHPTQFASNMFETQPSTSHMNLGFQSKEYPLKKESTVLENQYDPRDESKENMTERIEQLKTELDELKQRRQKTRHEIEGMENLTLRQRFQDILHTLNQDIMYKEMEYQGLLVLQNSDDI